MEPIKIFGDLSVFRIDPVRLLPNCAPLQPGKIVAKYGMGVRALRECWSLMKFVEVCWSLLKFQSDNIISTIGFDVRTYRGNKLTDSKIHIWIFTSSHLLSLTVFTLENVRPLYPSFGRRLELVQDNLKIISSSRCCCCCSLITFKVNFIK